MAVVADRAFTSRSTLQRIEEGDSSVGMGIDATVLHGAGIAGRSGQLADLSVDEVGWTVVDRSLLQRVRLKSPKG